MAKTVHFRFCSGYRQPTGLRWTRVGKNYSRDTSVTVSLSYSQAFLPTYFGYGIGASAAYIGTAYSESGNPNAYTWKYQFDRTIADVYFTLFQLEIHNAVFRL